jgi:arylsulfatase A-like enzyme
MDVHQYVYDEDTALFGTTYSDIYDNSIRWVDRVVGSVIDELDARDLRQRTLVVVVADHGEAFGEHDREGHARDVYGEVTTTPFIVSFPFRLEQGLVVEARSENVDVWPTLLDLLDLPPLQDPDGRSRVSEILAAAPGGGAIPPATPGFAHLDQNWARDKRPARPMVAVNDGPYRLVMGNVAQGGSLYDKSVDPSEQVDIAAEQPEVLARMKGLVRDYLERPPAPWGRAPEVTLEGAELEQLRALGYSVE